MRHDISFALAATQAHHRAILDAALDAIVTIDGEGLVVEFNAAAERMFGYAEAQAVGREMAELIVPPQLRELHRRGLARQVATGNSTVMGQRVEMEAMRSDGTVFPVELSIVPVPQPGGPRLFTGFIRDVSERQQSRAEISRAADRLATTLESISDGFFTLDHEWRFTFLNKRTEGILDRPRGELLGRNMWEAFPEGVGTRFEVEYQRAMAERLTVEFEEYFAPLHRWIHITAYPADDGGLAVYFRDVTKRKAAEQAREALEAKLRDSQRMEAIGRLAGGVAHDFNNILGAILGNLELARRECGGNAAALESLAEIGKASHRARDLVGQILSFSRRQPVNRRRLDIGALVGESVGMLRSTLPTRIRIDTRIDPAAPVVLGDATQVGQVILNLCTNAVQAIGNATGWIEVSTGSVTLGEDREDGLKDLAPGPYACLRVSDTGQGMDAETLRQIFEPFFTTKAVGEGTGLGLSVVHGIVRAHGGGIAVHSEPGRGTRFELYFPVIEGAPEARAVHPATRPAMAGSGQHILYLDDDESLLFLVRRLLAGRGYRVSAFLRQDEALAALRADPGGFDLFVTDHNMPGLSGLEVASAARAVRADLPIAVASGYLSEELVCTAREHGVSELIFKPNVVTEFIDVVERLARGMPAAPSSPGRA